MTATTGSGKSMDAPGFILAAIAVSAIGALFYNVLPLFAGTAQDSMALDNSQIGFLGSAFFLGYNAATISAFYWIRRWSWRRVTLVMMPLAALGLYMTTLSHDYRLLLLSTAFAGGAFSVLYGIGTTVLSDTANPARWFGLKIAAEGCVGAVLMLLVPGLLVEQYGFPGLIWGILIAMLVLAPFLLWLPAAGSAGIADSPAVVNTSGVGPHRLAIWCALAAAMVFFAGSSAIWAFLERLGANAGHSAELLGQILALTLVCATAGSLAAAGLGRRFGNARSFGVCLVLVVLSLGLLTQAESFNGYVAGCCLFTLSFGAGLPFVVAEIAEQDTDGRYAVLSVPAIGIGAMIGPGLGGMLYRGDSAASLLLLVAAAMALAGLLIWMSESATQRRRAAFT